MINAEILSAHKELQAELAAEKDYTVIENRGGRGLIHRQCCLDTETLPDWFDEQLLTSDRYKHDTTSTVAPCCYGDNHWVIKRYNRQNFVHGLKLTLRSSRARRAFLVGLLLRKLGINTPKPLAYLETRSGILPGNSYILYEKSSGDTLHDLLMTGRLQAEQWPSIVDRTRILVGKLHRLGITHGDIKHTNLMLCGERLEVIDLDSLRIHRMPWRFARHQGKDLRAVEKRIGGDPEAYVAYKKVALANR